MKASDNFLKTCTVWLSEISVYRLRICEMKKKLQNPEHTSANEHVNEKVVFMLQKIQIALNKLSHTEQAIIYILHENVYATSYNPQLQKQFFLEGEEELFDNMKNSYNLYIELQKTFNSYLKEGSSPSYSKKLFYFPVIQPTSDHLLN